MLRNLVGLGLARVARLGRYSSKPNPTQAQQLVLPYPTRFYRILALALLGFPSIPTPLLRWFYRRPTKKKNRGSRLGYYLTKTKVEGQLCCALLR